MEQDIKLLEKIQALASVNKEIIQRIQAKTTIKTRNPRLHDSLFTFNLFFFSFLSYYL
jgi:hypothetical protein